MKGIAYYKWGYKYQLKEMCCSAIDLKPVKAVNTDYINLDTEGGVHHET